MWEEERGWPWPRALACTTLRGRSAAPWRLGHPIQHMHAWKHSEADKTQVAPHPSHSNSTLGIPTIPIFKLVLKRPKMGFSLGACSNASIGECHRAGGDRDGAKAKTYIKLRELPTSSFLGAMVAPLHLDQMIRGDGWRRWGCADGGVAECRTSTRTKRAFSRAAAQPTFVWKK